MSKERKKRVKALVKIGHLRESSWIGLSAAIEWIAMRGRTMTLANYEKRMSEAAEKLVETLNSKLNPQEAERFVMGLKGDPARGRHEALPQSIWFDVDVDEEDLGKSRYGLGLAGTNDEWGANLTGHSTADYPDDWHDLKIDTGFVLDNWPPDHAAIEPVTTAKPIKRRCGTERERNDYAGHVIADAPDELLPFTMEELESLIKIRFSGATRTQCRAAAKEALYGVSPPKRGPKGKRAPNRQEAFKEFRQKLITAELRN